jgi:SAM-dependent methyltransferase
MRIEYHRTMLADHVRNEAFHAALKRVIVPGQTKVVDIGCGTGFLGFMAAKLGAKRVVLIENAEIATLAKKLTKANGFRNIEVVPAHSTELEPPERFDVAVSETLGNYAFEENIIETLGDARDRYLEPGGVLIPGKIVQMVCPVVSPKLHADLTTWDKVGFDLDFTAAREMGLNNIYVRWLAPSDLLGGGSAMQIWDKVDLAKATKTTRNGNVTWDIKAPALITGLAIWWSAELINGISLATGPTDPRTHWEQLYLPVAEPFEVRKGDTLTARLRSTTSYGNGTNVTWTITVTDSKGRDRIKQSMDLSKGFLP